MKLAPDWAVTATVDESAAAISAAMPPRGGDPAAEVVAPASSDVRTLLLCPERRKHLFRLLGEDFFRYAGSWSLRRDSSTTVVHYSLLAKDASGIGLDLRLAVSTAEGLRAEIASGFRARFGRALAQALGIIEVGLPVLNAAAAASKPTALGRPLPAYDVWLRDEDGKPMLGPGSPERTGEICIRGPGLFDAYLSPWTPSAKLLEPDGFRTGDQGYFDSDGVLFLAGRRHNRINMAGMKFFSEEVEEVIARVRGVRECRVFAREHEKLGEIPVAEIVPDDPAHPPARGELIAACRAALPAYKIPREFRVADALARTATGKVQR